LLGLFISSFPFGLQALSLESLGHNGWKDRVDRPAKHSAAADARQQPPDEGEGNDNGDGQSTVTIVSSEATGAFKFSSGQPRFAPMFRP
jgi:hypothetical protein